jgi:uncharacterized protein with ParB-like and HNH nuclease domain
MKKELKTFQFNAKWRQIAQFFTLVLKIDLMSNKLSAVRIYEELKDKGYHLSYSSLSRYIRNHNIKNTTCVRFHTAPGEEAQVDFGDIGRRYNGTQKLDC